MADAYGRLAGRACVCMSTPGPGATNLLTGVADAFLDAFPVVAITGQADLKRIHKELHQYINIVEMCESVSKWNGRIETPEVIPQMVRKAFKLAESEKPGPTHLELPENIASMGFFLPAAIVARLVHPQNKVVALSGDGGFLLNLQDLETAVRMKLNMAIVVFHDRCYSLIKLKSIKKIRRFLWR